MAANEKVSSDISSKSTRIQPGITVWLEWPRSVIWFGIALFALYGQGLSSTVRLWLHRDDYSHGVFIFPLCAFVLYLNRQAIREAQPRPSLIGFPVLVAGLLLQVAGYILRLEFLEMWSLIPVLAGAVLLLHGREMWRITRFAVLFSFFALPLPLSMLSRISTWIQSASTTGARGVMQTLGYTVIQRGNLIDIPGYTLEVADVCSGFKKLTALIAFSLLYGYLFPIGPWKRLLLLCAAIPIAVVANILRVSGLIAVTSAWGLDALHMAHNWGEIIVLGIAFFLFVSIGKLLGCKTIRFGSQSSESVDAAITRRFPSNAVYLTACLVLMLTAFATDRSVARLEFPRPIPAAIDRFPVVIGPWNGGEDRPMNSDVREKLKTACSRDRVYTNTNSRQGVQLLLLTGSDPEDFHNPAICFPSQGWTLINRRHFRYNGQDINAMDAEQGSERVMVWYWWYSNDPLSSMKVPNIPFARDIYRLRFKAAGENVTTSLFVRAIVPASPDAEPTMKTFVNDIWPHLEALAATGGERFAPNRMLKRTDRG
jgi:exosortase